ncbi:sulfatase-like hydrolase/transferase [Lunatimonas salinarum]|uniref:sulfatase-like hydrolase/transferase n=1 Tax=Lunatimonas salinarum TaxID=1774590 RepID=UPI001AE0CD78|nr:sulfatase-like hydrolase/transferase [Lunatimonas salinarum]
MNRPYPFPCLALLMVFLLGLLGSCDTGPEQTELPLRPHVVFIFADDMGYGDIRALNAASKIPTPNLDRMVKEGMHFTNAHASASVCTPSRYGLLTGRYAFRSEAAAFGIGGFAGPVVEEGRETLPKLLKRAGYHTGIVGKWHLGLGWQTKDGAPARLDPASGRSNVDYALPVTQGPRDVGFDYSYIHPASLDIPPYVFIRNHQVVNPDVVLTSSVYPLRQADTEYAWDKKHSDDNAIYWQKGVWWREGEMSADFRVADCHATILGEGLSYIQQHVAKGVADPFFLYLPLTGPHTPWLPSPENQGKSGAGVYGDFVLDIDQLVGRIIEELDRQGIADQTLLLFSSDNGAYWPDSEIALFGHDPNAGRRGQKGDVWDGGHRTPLIARWPGTIGPGTHSDALVSLTDVVATLAAMTQTALGEGQAEDSQSFWGVLRDHSAGGLRTEMVHHSSRSLYALRSGGWKYVEGLGSGGFTDPGIVRPGEGDPAGQLYDEAKDPAERDNLYAHYPEVVKELSAKLAAIRGK